MVAAIPWDNAQPMGRSAQNAAKSATSEWCVEAGKQAMNEVEQETAQDSAEENSIDSVNINSIHFNKNFSLITAKLKMSTGINNVIVPYKVDTCSVVTSCYCIYTKIIS